MLWLERSRFLLWMVLGLVWSTAAFASDILSREELAELIMPPFSLGEPVNDKGVWTVLNSGGAETGYVFETEPLAPLPGFSGAPINVLVTLDLEGRFVNVRLIEHNEPIFVSGLGEAPFYKFFEQYRGHAISSSMVVGTPYGEGDAASSLVYLDGVTKATASVRIAHESVLAATLAVAREKMQGVSTAPPAYPNRDYSEELTWDDLVDQGLATRKLVSNAEVQEAFAGTLWATDDPEAVDYPDEPFLDLWIVDLGPPAIAQAVLDPDTFDELQNFLEIATHDEPILVIDAGRHGLVSPEFVRNTSPDWLSAEQDGLPVALRDADLFVDLQRGVPDGEAMILRTDRRLGFDPARPWTMNVLAVREHGMFHPEIGTVTLTTEHVTDERFFSRPVEVKPAPPWLEALRNRQADIIVLGIFLTGLVGILAFAQDRLSAMKLFTPVRLTLLAITLGFIGWWGQGQLSIVTVLGVLQTALNGGSFAFLLYDPFSLIIWAVVLISFVIWGRGFFCGWLCPFGALQEFAHYLGRLLRLPEWRLSEQTDRQLKRFKYAILFGLLAVTVATPHLIDKVAEVEPFKTSITVYFVREWYFVAYAVLWLALGMVMFKSFCRYVCPLGAVMAIGGMIRARSWIPRRAECGSPCKLCTVRCNYQAIDKRGKVDYSECFQCLDCVTIYHDETQCVPKILAAKSGKKRLQTGNPVPAQRQVA